MISDNGFTCPTVIHGSAVVEKTAKISAGVQYFPMHMLAATHSSALVSLSIPSAVVSHDCILADLVNMSPGSLLAGGVEIGYGTLIGMGVTVNLNVSIGENVRIGNGATIKTDVPDGSFVKAGMIWPQ